MTVSGPIVKAKASAEDDGKLEFGTFMGVFTPSVLTILGAIMYLRFGWVVGNAGLSSTIVIVLFFEVIFDVITIQEAYGVEMVSRKYTAEHR